MKTSVELPERVDSISFEYKADEENEMYEKIKHDHEINISNPMVDILNNNEQIGIYEYKSQWRLILPFFITLLVLVHGNMDKFKSKSSDSTISVLSILLSLFMIIFSLSTLICSVIMAKKKVNNKKYIIKCFYIINQFFGIPVPIKEDQEKEFKDLQHSEHSETFNNVSSQYVYNIDRRKYGFILLLYVLYSSFNVLLIESIFPLKSSIDCESEEILLSDSSIHSICIVNQSSVGMIYVFVLGLGIFGVSYYRITNKCSQGIDNYFEKHMNKRIKINDKIKNIEENMNERIKEWQKSKKSENRKLELIAIIICCLIYHFVSYGIIRNEIFKYNGNIQIGSIIFCLYIYIGDGILLSMLFYFFNKVIFYFYSFPAMIMKQLSYQFKANNINDIILWWELRKYYLYCIIQIYAAGMNGIILATLIGSLITLIFFASTLGTFDLTVSALFLCWTIIIIIYAFSIVTKAVNFHEIEISHYHTINKERLRLEIQRYFENEIFDNNDEAQKEEKIFDIILKDIKENPNTIRIFGIRMNANFLLFLRGCTVTIGIAAYFAS